LYSFYPDFNASDLSYFSQELFKIEIKKDREKLFEYGKIDIRPYLNDLKKNDNDVNEIIEDDDNSPSIKKESVLDFGFEKESTNKIMLKKNRGDLSVGEISEDKKELENDSKRNLTKKINRKDITRKINFKGDRKKKKVKKKKRRETSTKRTLDIKKNNKIKIIPILLFFVLFYFIYSEVNENKKNIVDGDSKKTGKNNIKNIFEKNLERNGEKSKGLLAKGKITLTDFDSVHQKVFINGAEVNVDVFGSFEVPLMKKFVLRIEETDLENYVKNLKLTMEKSEIEIKVPEMSVKSYGYLVTYGDCIKGVILFDLFGEKRKEILPIDPQLGLAFPLDGENIPTEHRIKIQKKGEKIIKNFDFKINSEDDVIDLCELLKK
jgi:serine/threonine-protein kinase